MIRTIALTLALTLGATSAFALQCKDPVTKRFVACKKAVADSAAPMAAAPAVVVAGPKCKVGVRCGNACIARGKICHKPG